MSSGELNRVELMGRVGSGDLKLNDAAVMLELSYRQTKRLWVSAGGQQRAETWQCRTLLESQQAAETALPSFEFD